MFAMVIDRVLALLAREISRFERIPMIGIGAGRDGQIPVTHEILGLYALPPALRPPLRRARLGDARRIRALRLRL